MTRYFKLTTVEDTHFKYDQVVKGSSWNKDIPEKHRDDVYVQAIGAKWSTWVPRKNLWEIDYPVDAEGVKIEPGHIIVRINTTQNAMTPERRVVLAVHKKGLLLDAKENGRGVTATGDFEKVLVIGSVNN